MPIDVASYLKFTPTDDTGSFTADTEGHVYYDDSEDALKHYDGSSWEKVNTIDVNYLRPGDGQYTVDSYTKLLIHSDTSNGSTTFVDSSANAHTLTVNNVAHSTTQAKIGGSSYFNEGDVTNHSRRILVAANADWSFGTGNFTVEYWWYPTSWSSDSEGMFAMEGGRGDTFAMSNSQSSPQTKVTIVFDYNGGDEDISNTGWQPTLDTWQHMAVVRSSGTVKFYVDGSEQDSFSADYNMSDTVDLSWGCGGNRANKDAYYDELRVSNIARWTSNFTVY